MIAISPNAAARKLADDLRRRFDLLLADPDGYCSRAIAECAAYPEGDLLPFVFPAIGYASDAIAHPERETVARDRVAALVELALPSVVRRVCPPDGRLDRLRDYGDQGVYLGQLGVALGSWRRIGGDDRWEAIHSRVADVLHDAMVAADGGPLRSFPEQSWPFDTLPCLLALRLHDLHRGCERSTPLIERHLRWVRARATSPELGLPYSQLADDAAGRPVLPRGCDLGYRVWLLAHLDREGARSVYQAFARHYWIERGYLAGFAEWPHGENLGEDADSGPIVLGMGLAATGFGIGAALLMRDRYRAGRLLFELSMARTLFSLFRGTLRDRYPYNPQYATGSLMGDACLFGVLKWAPFGAAEPRRIPTTMPATLATPRSR